LLRKLVAPILVGAVLVGGAGWAGVANAATSVPAASAHAHVHQGVRRWLHHHGQKLRRAVIEISAKAIGISTKDLAKELRSGKSIAEVAAEHNVSAQTVIDALVHAADARVARAEAHHRITSAEAAKVEAALPGVVTRIVDHPFGHHHRHGRLRRAAVVVSAKAIGISPKVLVSELRSGKTIAEVAAEHNVSAQTVVDALVHAGDTRVARELSNHKLTTAQAAKLDAELPGVATKLVNHQFGRDHTAPTPSAA
jgi:uncharacterized protein (DUF433 family)